MVHWVLAVDASAVAKKAFETVEAMLNPGSGVAEEFSAVHAYIPEKQSQLPANQRAPTVVAGFERELSRVKSRFDITPGNTIKLKIAADAEKLVAGGLRATVLKYCVKKDAEFIVLGSWGDGGEKHDALGSFTDGIVRMAPCSVVVIKAFSPKPPHDGSRYVVAVDDSNAAMHAVRVVASIIKPTQILVLVTTSHHKGPHDDAILAKHSELAASLTKAKIETVFHTRPQGSHAGVSLCEYADRISETDFLVVGSNALAGSDAEKMRALGSVAAYVTQHSRCHNIVVKPDA